MEVICPSYGRTGTTSMKEALQILGFGPCYHMYNVLFTHLATHPQLWLDGYKGRGLAIKKIFGGYKSVADWPAADFYKEIMKENPDAKVILTLRDPDEWWESMIHSIHRHADTSYPWGMFFLLVLVPCFRKWSYLVRHIATLNMEKEEAKADYIGHNAEVKANVPADKLLEFSVKEGWEPLCSFLGVPIPDVPFPRMNSRGEAQRITASGNAVGWLLMLTTVAAAGASVVLTSRRGGARAGGAVAAVEVCVLSSCIMEAVKVYRFSGGKH